MILFVCAQNTEATSSVPISWPKLPSPASECLVASDCGITASGLVSCGLRSGAGFQCLTVTSPGL